ncbi:ABC transporter ATP-binding protein [Thermaurantiacus sp.]
MMALSVSGLSLALGGRPVLEDISAILPPARVTVVLGPNGAGKSMLLACLAGLRAPDCGKVTLNGDAVVAMDPRQRARRIGLLPQKGEVHWDVDVRTLVSLGRAPHNSGWGLTAADRAAIESAMVATDTLAHASRPVQRLSGGEQARVLLARVLAGQPEWLLADEPLSSLDPAYQLDMLERLRAVAANGTGVVLVLHDLTQAARIADHALLLKAGRLLASGPANGVLQPDLLAAAYDVSIWRGADADGAPVLLPMRPRLPVDAG